MSDFYTRLMLQSGRSSKQAVVAAPGGVPAPPPQAGPQGAPPGMPPMDPAMMGGMPPQGMPPMDPAMMGGMPPMDPAMMGGMPPMDPAMMGGGAPQPTPADLFTEVQSLKEMVQQLMDAQMAMMQVMMPPGAGMPPMAPPPPGPGGPPMDPAMMGLPSAPPPGMIAQASFEDEDDARNLFRAAVDFLR
jgi:hypothetical protein